MNTCRYFSIGFKLRVVLMALNDAKAVDELSVKHDLNPKLIQKWIKQFQSIVAKMPKISRVVDRDKNNYDNMCAELGRLRMENEFLRSSIRMNLSTSTRKKLMNRNSKLSLRYQQKILSVG